MKSLCNEPNHNSGERAAENGPCARDFRRRYQNEEQDITHITRPPVLDLEATEVRLHFDSSGKVVTQTNERWIMREARITTFSRGPLTKYSIVPDLND